MNKLLKNTTKIIIWTIGLIILWFIWPSYGNEPKFIREHELITWDMAGRTFVVLFGIWWLQNLTSNNLFNDDDQEEWSKKVNNRIDKIEKQLDVLGDWAICIDEEKNHLSKKASAQESRILNEMQRTLIEFEQRIKKDFLTLEESHFKLRKKVWDHTHDCPYIFICNSCNHEAEMFNFISNDDGDLMCPTCHSSSSIEEKPILRHLQSKN